MIYERYIMTGIKQSMNNDRIREINEYISVLPSSEEPLSADVYFIKGKSRTYIVDVGSNDEACKTVGDIPEKRVILTHFHEDHTDNIRRLDIPDEDLLVGNYTRKYIGRGTEVDKKTIMDDGVKITVVPIPNSHAKGALCVTVNDEYLIIGDAFYSNVKGYNVSLLSEEIKLLKELDFRYVLMSHKDKLHEKDEIISILEKVFKKREKDNPYISVGAE